MSPATAVSCPAVTVAAQRTIHNDGDFALGRVPLTRAFAESCNTTFAQAGVASGADRLAEAAADFGFGTHFDPGVPAYSGDFPRDARGNALAEASIGQGTVQATTLDMAVVAGAVADGTYRSPTLVPEHLSGHRATKRLPPSVTAGLRSMMGDVVTVRNGGARRSARRNPRQDGHRGVRRGGSRARVVHRLPGRSGVRGVRRARRRGRAGGRADRRALPRRSEPVTG